MSIQSKSKISVRALCLIALGAQTIWGSVHAEEVLVAVASNFFTPMTEIAERFQAETGHEVRLASGSSGRFVAQIRNGAPFQVFLSADQERVEALIQSGHAIEQTRFTYANGALLLWSSDPELSLDAESLSTVPFRRLALANPDLAPYGKAAVQVLDALGLDESTRSRWVLGENIAQTYQFVATGNAELGFIAASQLSHGETSSGVERAWRIPESYHEPIRQDAVLIRSAEGCAACRELLDYLQGPVSEEIMLEAGYRQR